MKILFMGIFRNETRPSLELCHETELSSYSRFTKGSIAEFLSMAGKEMSERTAVGKRQVIEEQGNFIHVYSHSKGIAGVIISDQEYPDRVAQGILNKICDEFLTKYQRSAITGATKGKSNPLPFPELSEYIKKFQNPEEGDTIAKLQKEMDEVKDVLHKTIEAVLERGEKMDSLVAKSDGLSAQSKMFYTQAKKQNSCCIVM